MSPLDSVPLKQKDFKAELKFLLVWSYVPKWNMNWSSVLCPVPHYILGPQGPFPESLVPSWLLFHVNLQILEELESLLLRDTERVLATTSVPPGVNLLSSPAIYSNSSSGTNMVTEPT